MGCTDRKDVDDAERRTTVPAPTILRRGGGWNWKRAEGRGGRGSGGQQNIWNENSGGKPRSGYQGLGRGPGGEFGEEGKSEAVGAFEGEEKVGKIVVWRLGWFGRVLIRV